MRSLLRLQNVFHAVTSLSLALTGCSGAVAGGPAEGGDAGDAGGGVADGSHPDAGIDNTGFPLNVCEGPDYHPLAGVTVSPAVDYLELRLEYAPLPGGPDAGPPMFTSLATEGAPCMTAADVPACKTRLANLRSGTGWMPDGAGGPLPPQHTYLVYTRGDSVAAVASLDALATFVSPLANVKSAALLASERGHRFDCTRNNARATSDGFELITETGQTCGAGTGIDQNLVSVTTTIGTFLIEQTVRIQDGDPHCAIGRRPEGFSPTRSADAAFGASLGAYFAEMAELEAASVYAFERLVRELRAHGAPEALVSAARAAQEDEVRHTRTTANLAARFGAGFRAPKVEPRGVRSLFDVALENAVEGCVRETFGALQATYQATHATDRAIARAMRVIAADETRHAALAWDIAEWIEPLLSDDERARIETARQDAVAGLARDLAASVAADVTSRAGVPDAGAAGWLLGQVRGELWAA